ncbi:DNA gyrase inhibitor YacG [Terriglobus sp.]|uniref:DNA gyrase inhibitor YacG n=1 Tax=Terriglobus sp. TaxID=1889013 RepID=UPI003AFFF63A
MEANTAGTSAARKTLSCPTCRKPVATGSEDFPFCSDRCRLLDLGKWASGEYRISSPVLDPDLLEDIESGQLRGGNES